MALQITKPFFFFDTETTGTQTETDRIVELAITKVNLDGTRETRTWRINPTIPIPTEASDVHGITDDMVANCPTFKEVAKEIYDFVFGADPAGFNIIDFDIPIMVTEMKRAEMLFLDWEFNIMDVYKIYKKLHPQNLSALFKHYTGQELEDAHNANNDNVAAEVILSNILSQNFTKDVTPEELDNLVQGERKRYDLAGKLYKNAEGIVCWAFGKHIDKPYDYDMGFLQWVLSKDFPEDTKNKLKELLK